MGFRSKSLRLPIHVCPYDFRRDLRDDGISEGAQASQSVGNPMSQQTNGGFNAPGFSVCSDGPLVGVPVATAASAFSDMVFRVNSAGYAFSLALWRVGVPHICIAFATCERST